MFHASKLASTAAVGLLLAAVPAAAQVLTEPHVSQPMGPQTVKPPEALAQVQQEPDACAAQVHAEQNDKWLSVRRGDFTPLRESTKVWLFWAGRAASAGDEPACWKDLGVAELMNSP